MEEGAFSLEAKRKRRQQEPQPLSLNANTSRRKREANVVNGVWQMKRLFANPAESIE
jgi:hypothetical protein